MTSSSPDRRRTDGGDGNAQAAEGQGEHLRLRDFLGGYFFEPLTILAALGDPKEVRIIIGFDQ